MLSLLLDAACGKAPRKTALICDDAARSYEELRALTERLAASLLERGLRPGDRVAFLLPNCPEIVLCYYACFKIGAIAVPLNIRFGPELLTYTLNHSGARVFITEPARFEEIAAFRGSLTALEQLYLTRRQPEPAGVASFNDLLSGPVSTASFPEVDETSPAAIYYTSGTTGLPKAVVHTHGSLHRATTNQIAEIKIAADDRTLIMFPVCYLIGFGSQVLPFLSAGASCVLMPRFEPVLVFQAIEAHRPTKVYGFPKLYQDLVNHPNAGRHNLQSLDFCFSAGEAIPVAVQERFERIFGIGVTEGCGMTELQVYSMNPPYGPKKAGSIGKPISGMEIALIDDSGQRVLLPGVIGEMIVRGGSMTAGYWRDPDRTARTIINGWLHTGDLAYQDEEGFFWFVSRKSEVIRHRSGLVSPIEVEAVLYQHPEVKEAAVTGLSGGPDGEVVQAHVILSRHDPAVDPQQLIAFVRTRLVPHKVPVRITMVDSLPYGPTGKIDRITLRNRAQGWRSDADDSRGVPPRRASTGDRTV